MIFNQLSSLSILIEVDSFTLSRVIFDSSPKEIKLIAINSKISICFKFESQLLTRRFILKKQNLIFKKYYYLKNINFNFNN